MPTRVELGIGEYYHLYNRGTDKRSIFQDNYDYERFVKFLYLANNTSPVKLREAPPNALSLKRDGTLVDIGAYCLMPNHFHIIVKEHSSGGISAFMAKLGTAHATFFNKKYDRTGALFEGRFKAKHANQDGYLKYLFAYIHLNPIKLIEPKWKETGLKDTIKAAEHLAKYPYSSYPEYKTTINSRPEAKIINKSAFPQYFEKAEDFDQLVEYWLKYRNIAPI